MDTPEWQEIEKLFHRAAELSPDRRAAYLDEACADDERLRGEVEALLAAHTQADQFLETPVVENGVKLLDSSVSESLVGERLGAYRVIKQIGRGGMGTVYLAERADDQYSKHVAIKVIRSGASGRTLVERFHRERQILANLDHPNITRLLDGGITGDGRPFIVMEFVEGTPIDGYCDRHRLSVAQRVNLFLDVCAAVQYAHQNLVIHRDLKHGNILVTADGTPKLLDFGIAKLLDSDPSATRETQLTRTAMPMTPDFASPEQVRGAAVTTSTEIYALAVLLYRLLTGTHPYRLTGTNPAEFVRIICEEEPVRPSLAIGGLPTEIPAVPDWHHRLREPSTERLRRRLTGDLDNIILKGLRKEPHRRYGSVEQLSQDLRRHLDGLPVSARPNTLRYRAGKFLRRHLVGTLAVALVMLTLVAGIFTTTWQARIAAAERDSSRIEARKADQVTRFLHSMLSFADPYSRGHRLTVVELLEEAAGRVERELGGQPEIEASVRTTIGMTYLNLGIQDSAERQLRRALELHTNLYGRHHPETAVAMRNLSLVLAARGDLKAAEPLCREALAISREAPGGTDLQVAATLNTLGELLLRKGEIAAAEQAQMEALEIRRRELDELHPNLAESLNDLAVVFGTKGDYARAEQLHQQALEITRRVRGPEHPETATALSNLAGMKEAQQDYAAAERLFREALALRRKVLGPDHPDVAWTLGNFAFMLFEKGDYAEAARLSRELLDSRGTVLPDEHPMVAAALHVLGRSHLTAGDPAAALPPLRESLELRQRNLPPQHWLIANSRSVLGEAIGRLGRHAEAEPLLLDSAALLETALGKDHERTLEAWSRVVQLYQAWGKEQQASDYRLKLSPP